MDLNPFASNVGYLQTKIHPGDLQANLFSVRDSIEKLAPPVDSFLVLPELWATGFAYKRTDVLADSYEFCISEIIEICKKLKIFIAGSLPYQVSSKPERYVNRMVILGPEGIHGRSDKQFVFPGEEVLFNSAESPPRIIETSVGCFGCLVCYDLRFPTIARSLSQQGADVLVCSAQWPAARIDHWRALLIARAIENQIFIVGCNGIGKNGLNTLGGGSVIVSPDGDILASAGTETASSIVELDWNIQRQCRNRFNSVSQHPQRSSALDKILVPEDCAAIVRRRSSIGQKIVLVKIEKGSLELQEMEKIADARRRGDFLVAGVDCARAAVIGSFGKLGVILKRYAALENIDIVFDLNLLDEDLERVFNDCCDVVII